MGDTIYVLGHSQAEIRRLIKQASIVQATTERLLRSAGIERGMRVLDLGCGAGDVSMLAATLVGVSGSVVGIDRNAQVLANCEKAGSGKRIPACRLLGGFGRYLCRSGTFRSRDRPVRLGPSSRSSRFSPNGRAFRRAQRSPCLARADTR
jgi:SAM-dependent methyltransferase